MATQLSVPDRRPRSWRTVTTLPDSAPSRLSAALRSGWRVAAASARLACRTVSAIVPKRSQVWVFGTRGDHFIDNPMYLYEYVHATRPDLHPVWISGDGQVVGRLRDSGRTAHRRGSVAGIRDALTAKVNIYSSDPSDTSFAFTGGAINVNLYHGLPLKQIEFAIESQPAYGIYHPATLAQRLRSHTLYAAKWAFQDVLATTSQWAEKTFRRSYAERVGTTVLGTSPRVSAALVKSPLDPELFSDERQLAELLAARSGPALLFAPTWRRYEWTPRDVLGETPALVDALAASDTTLVIKGHLNEPTAAQGSDRIVVVPSHLDATAVLRAVDGVITDYSSIAFDAAMLGKPVIWCPFDLERYQRSESPQFNLDYQQLTRDGCVSSPDELHTAIAQARWRTWHLPTECLETLWGEDAADQLRTGNERLVDAIVQRSGR